MGRRTTVGGRVLARLDVWANRVYGSRSNPLYHSGSIVVGLVLVLIVTGLYLLLFYRIGTPWDSVSRITGQVWLGRWIRGVHRFAADAAVVAAVVHAFRMYVQRRSWGPRALAWLSGVALLGVILLTGWTGYVLIWDVHAQLLAVEGARLFEALPILAEPVSRTFVGAVPPPGGFFFLNLFAHIALPIGVGLLIWVHVARLARPVLLPPRPVLWGVIGALVLLAVIWPIGMSAEASGFRIPDRVPLDAFYTIWLPLSRALPEWAVWLSWIALFAMLFAVPFVVRHPVLAAAVVNERVCTGCEQCALDCPYTAITMHARTDGRATLVARVDADLCTSCGVCIGSCGPMLVGPPGATGQDQLAAAQAYIAREKPGPRDVVVMGCVSSAANVDSVRSHGARLYTMGCAGVLHTSTIEQMIRGGAGGVLVVMCPERDCHNREGGRWLAARMYDGRAAELKPRVDRRRVRIVAAAAGEADVLRDALEAFSAEIAFLSRAEPDSVDLIDLCRTGADDPDNREFGT